ncbi:MAG: Imm39 family immunity protein [Candidatus Latescibacterota bacterium]|nr:Imm39 family immunity protein [Candidatus Latescibacterota bacterium]
MNAPIQRNHDRCFVIGAASLTQARLHPSHTDVLIEIRDEIGDLLERSEFFRSTPFSWISLMIRLGLVNEESPHYKPMHRDARLLPLAIEIDTHEILGCDVEHLKRTYMRAVLTALLHVGREYSCDVELIAVELDRLGPMR